MNGSCRLCPGHATALDKFAERYWDYYAALQDYRAGPSEASATKLRQEFDELFATRTGYDALDDRIAKTAAKREELLTVLSYPSVPLHNNASELGARVSARCRDVSLHSRSVGGARRWTFLRPWFKPAKNWASAPTSTSETTLAAASNSPRSASAFKQRSKQPQP